MSITIFENTYDGELLSDIGRDIYEAFDTSFNPKASVIVDDEYGIPKGHFVVTIEYFPESGEE